MLVVILLVSIDLIILTEKIIFKACVVTTEDRHVEQPSAASQA
jgi:hypothetical protein